ncbi:hypothetical protein EDC96DRAFT_241462 [Choanephora cucurbitarum]|nr:hypothetical protein EDC96DRAFT_241462 [Choanephora cucurbitarum]
MEGFVHLSTRCDIIQLLANDEYIYRHAILQLMSCVHRMDTRFIIQISEMIYKGIEKRPQDALWVRFKLVEMQVLPDLVTRLTAMYCKDTVEFLNGVFTGKSTWFLAQSANSGQYFIKMKQRMMKEIESSFSNQHPITLLASIRALSGIIGFFGIKLVDTEVALCLRILGQTKHEKLVRLLLSLVLLAADQFLRKQNELATVLNELLQSGISELPLLLLVYFQTDAIPQIEDSVRSVLTMQLPIPRLGLFEMQKLFKSLKITPATVNTILPPIATINLNLKGGREREI